MSNFTRPYDTRKNNFRHQVPFYTIIIQAAI